MLCILELAKVRRHNVGLRRPALRQKVIVRRVALGLQGADGFKALAPSAGGI